MGGWEAASRRLAAARRKQRPGRQLRGAPARCEVRCAAGRPDQAPASAPLPDAGRLAGALGRGGRARLASRTARRAGAGRPSAGWCPPARRRSRSPRGRSRSLGRPTAGHQGGGESRAGCMRAPPAMRAMPFPNAHPAPPLPAPTCSRPQRKCHPVARCCRAHWPRAARRRQSPRSRTRMANFSCSRSEADPALRPDCARDGASLLMGWMGTGATAKTSLWSKAKEPTSGLGNCLRLASRVERSMECKGTVLS